jgi:hypothetical protein
MPAGKDRASKGQFISTHFNFNCSPASITQNDDSIGLQPGFISVMKNTAIQQICIDTKIPYA